MCVTWEIPTELVSKTSRLKKISKDFYKATEEVVEDVAYERGRKRRRGIG